MGGLIVIPNPTNDRLGFILKTYGKKRPDVVLAMVDIIAHTVGVDNWKQVVTSTAGIDPTVEKLVMGRSPTTDDLRITSEVDAVAMIVDQVNRLSRFRTRHRADPLFPWMASQLAKLPEHVSYGSTQVTTETEARKLRRAGTILAQWYEAKRPNLGGYNIQSALGEAKEWYEESGPVPQGEVVVELSDGWTAQELTTKEQLDREGEVMQHCVGSYFNEVNNDKTTIYSLRDAQGRPHVTIEVKNGHVEQVQGKQNEKPAAKYQPYVDEFEKWLESEGVSLTKIPKELQPYVDAMEAAGCGDDDDSLIAYASDWNENVYDAEEAAAWMKYVGCHEAELAGALKDENVTPDEFGAFPWLIVHAITENGGVPSKLDDMVTVAKMTVLLNQTADRRVPESKTDSSQLHMFDDPEGPRGRVPGHDPVGPTRKPLSLPGETYNNIQYRHIPSIYGIGVWTIPSYRPDDDFGEVWVRPAEEWLLEGFVSDESKDEYVAPWFINRFTPEEATRWWDAGVTDGYLAAELRRRRVKPELFADSDAPASVHQSLAEFDNLKARAKDDQDVVRFAKVVAEQIVDQFGLRPNKRRTSRRRVSRPRR